MLLLVVLLTACNTDNTEPVGMAVQYEDPSFVVFDKVFYKGVEVNVTYELYVDGKYRMSSEPTPTLNVSYNESGWNLPIDAGAMLMVHEIVEVITIPEPTIIDGNLVEFGTMYEEIYLAKEVTHIQGRIDIMQQPRINLYNPDTLEEVNFSGTYYSSIRGPEDSYFLELRLREDSYRFDMIFCPFYGRENIADIFLIDRQGGSKELIDEFNPINHERFQRYELEVIPRNPFAEFSFRCEIADWDFYKDDMGYMNEGYFRDPFTYEEDLGYPNIVIEHRVKPDKK